MNEEFHSYLRFVSDEEWLQYWSKEKLAETQASTGSKDMSSKVTPKSNIDGLKYFYFTPLGCKVEMKVGSANSQVCSYSNVTMKKLMLASESVRMEYFMAKHLLNFIVQEFEKSDSAISFVLNFKMYASTHASLADFEKMKDLARSVAAKKACQDALKEI